MTIASSLDALLDTAPDDPIVLRPGTKRAELLAALPAAGRREWLTEQVAILQVRITRTQEIEQRFRARAVARAATFWDEDQALKAEIIGQKLPRNPALTVTQLRQTPAGCDWLIQRWEDLAPIEPDQWTRAQRTLAVRLKGKAVGMLDPLTLAPLAEIDALVVQRERVAEHDEFTRRMVESDLSDDLGPEYAQLRRYEQTLFNRFYYFLGILRGQIAVPPPVPPQPDKPKFPARPNPAPRATEAKPPIRTAPEPPPPPPASPAASAPAVETVDEAEPADELPSAVGAERRRHAKLQQARKRQRQARRRRG